MKYLIKKTVKLKHWLSSKIPTFAPDKQKHYFVTQALAGQIAIVGAFLPKIGIIGLLILLAGCAAWELPTLIRSDFSQVSKHEAQQDLLMAVFAVFPYLFILIILQTK